MNNYKDLIVWQKSIKLVKEVYKVTSTFPELEKFGLVNQMRRCSVSIPSNIAEGFGRKNSNDNARFVGIAFGSALELETQIVIVKELGFVTKQEFYLVDNLLNEIIKMLYKYRETLWRSVN